MILLDNMTLDTLREAVRRNAGRAVLEISGGVTLDSVSLDGKRVEQVPGAVLKGSEVSLLGQSFLSRMGHIEISGDRMSIR